MNDRFKFRVWDNDEKEYIEDLDIVRLTQQGKFIFNNARNNIEPELNSKRFIFEQCTGLKDKNGKFIYEEDWVKDKDGYISLVVWFNGAWWLKSEPSQAMDRENEKTYAEFEVIGNIHENKELLEGYND